MVTERDSLIDSFVYETGWGSADRVRLRVDASTRSYLRLVNGQRSAILMNAPPASEAASCPPQATPEERLQLGYNAAARLAGPNLHAFTEISEMLRQAGLHAPEVFHADPENGLALIEDFGDNLYASYISDVKSEKKVYLAAIEALVHLHSSKLRLPVSKHYSVLEYDHLAQITEVDLLTDWYWPFLLKAKTPPDVQAAFLAAWDEVLSGLSDPEVFVLRDYHAENLLWLEQETGIARVGLIDFQDGLIGQPAYDIISLLEDARRDVPPELVQYLKQAYISAMQERSDSFNQEQFETDFAILAAQRNAKILGIFARLIARDGKAKYKDFMPRVAGLFRRDLHRPQLQPVLSWAREYFPELLAS